MVAAILVEPKGTYGVGMIGHAVATRATSAVLNNSAMKAAEAAGGIASTMPSKPFVIVKTNKRILISISNGISFSEPAVELAISDMKLQERKKKLLGQRLTFAFKDGSIVMVDAQRGQLVDKLL